MFIAYFDDAGTDDKKAPTQVVCSVVFKDQDFAGAEILVSLGVAEMFSEDQRDSFKEFHAVDLYHGHGVFEGIDKTVRFNVMKALLQVVHHQDIPVLYGAIDKKKLQQSAFAPAPPLNVAFKSCAKDIERWVSSNAKGSFCLFISDNTQHAKSIQATFRSMRKPMRPPFYDCGELPSIHDAMYFGDSTESLGIQIADLCAYFIMRHLNGDEETEEFYNIFADSIQHTPPPDGTREHGIVL